MMDASVCALLLSYTASPLRSRPAQGLPQPGGVMRPLAGQGAMLAGGMGAMGGMM